MKKIKIFLFLALLFLLASIVFSGSFLPSLSEISDFSKSIINKIYPTVLFSPVNKPANEPPATKSSKSQTEPQIINENPVCTDSDANEKFPNGRNPFERGLASFKNSQELDSCSLDSITLKEWYCGTKDEQLLQVLIVCSDYEKDYICYNGKCTITNKPEECIDTDELNFYKKGSVITKDGSVYTDVCVGNNIQEYYCKNGKVAQIIQNCELDSFGTTSCLDGSCLKRKS